MSQLNWEDARYFLALARLGRLAKAAKYLGISTVTLSRHLSYLQSKSLAPLLHRHSKGLSLTEEGRRLFNYLERAEAEIEAASDVISGSNALEISGTVRIAAPEGFALKVLTPRLGDLLEEHPSLRIEIVPQARGFSLSKREADVAVMVGKPSEKKLNFESLGRYRLGLYAARDYLHLHDMPISVDDLSGHRLIGYVDDLLFTESLNLATSVWSKWISQVSIYSPIGQVEAVKAGQGIGVLHKFLINDSSDFIVVLPEIQLEREFFLVTHQSSERIPRIRAVIDFLRGLSAPYDS